MRFFKGNTQYEAKDYITIYDEVIGYNDPPLVLVPRIFEQKEALLVLVTKEQFFHKPLLNRLPAEVKSQTEVISLKKRIFIDNKEITENSESIGDFYCLIYATNNLKCESQYYMFKKRKNLVYPLKPELRINRNTATVAKQPQKEIHFYINSKIYYCQHSLDNFFDKISKQFTLIFEHEVEKKYNECIHDYQEFKKLFYSTTAAHFLYEDDFLSKIFMSEPSDLDGFDNYLSDLSQDIPENKISQSIIFLKQVAIKNNKQSFYFEVIYKKSSETSLEYLGILKINPDHTYNMFLDTFIENEVLSYHSIDIRNILHDSMVNRQFKELIEENTEINYTLLDENQKPFTEEAENICKPTFGR